MTNERIAECRERVEQAQHTLAQAVAARDELTARRKPLVIAAAGDAEAASAASENRVALIDAEVACGDAMTALDKARADLAAAQAAAADAEAERRLAEGRKIAALMFEEAELVDEHFREAAKALQRREQLRMRLAGLGVLPETTVTALAHTSRLRRAIAHAGLARLLAEPVQMAHARPLAEADRASMAIRKPTILTAVPHENIVAVS